MLGRTEKLKMYERILHHCLRASSINEQQYKMLLIKGEARQGKTRILDEIVYVTPANVAVNSFILTEKDRKVIVVVVVGITQRRSCFKIPYQTMRLIFSQPLSLTTESSIKEKEQKILTLLRKIQVPDLLCVLNNMFGVNFKKSELYLSLSESERKLALRKMIKQLCYAVRRNSSPTLLLLTHCSVVLRQNVGPCNRRLRVHGRRIVGAFGHSF
jgi:adenylate cyclase 10